MAIIRSWRLNSIWKELLRLQMSLSDRSHTNSKIGGAVYNSNCSGLVKPVGGFSCTYPQNRHVVSPHTDRWDRPHAPTYLCIQSQNYFVPVGISRSWRCKDLPTSGVTTSRQVRAMSGLLCSLSGRANIYFKLPENITRQFHDVCARRIWIWTESFFELKLVTIEMHFIEISTKHNKAYLQGHQFLHIL